QKLLPEGATLFSVILLSDKTHLSTFSGDKQAWPVYITIRNVDKSVCQSPKRRAIALLGYLPIAKLQCFAKSECSLQGYRVFHYPMKQLLQLLVVASQDRVEMGCCDVYPILAAYITDYPEQCLVSCCKENRCPTCIVAPDQCGELLDSLYCDPVESLKAIHESTTNSRFADEGLREILEPFWVHLPYANVFACITPDLLHQLHKGVFKDHLFKWVSTSCEDEMDAQFMQVPPYQGLQIFKKGISSVTQWTGNEYRQMEKVFVRIISSLHSNEPHIIAASHAILDFICLAHYPSHSTSSLQAMKAALEAFHANKQVFVDLGLRSHFNIPKLHWLQHYVASIINFGSCDSLSTEIYKQLHIDFAKQGYRASNRKAYIQQMIKWLTCREKIRLFQSYLCWIACFEGGGVDLGETFKPEV
ncbi:hypothetical protein JAAARDRAFT_137388, partial [Jaapia argillacea MUCL 33604]